MNKPKTRNENIVIQEMEKEILIYDLKTNKAFCLNETSALIYGLCDGKSSVGEISQALNKKLKQSISEDLIWLALNDFKNDNLLEESERFEINFNGLSRRQVIKKVGFASMVMLPIVSSIVAPSAAAAQSGGIALLQSCPSGGGCQPGLTCVACQGGTCGGQLTCCQSSNTHQGPNTAVDGVSSFTINPFNSAHNFCVDPNGAATQCCSGAIKFVPFAPLPGEFSCYCA